MTSDEESEKQPEKRPDRQTAPPEDKQLIPLSLCLGPDCYPSCRPLSPGVNTPALTYGRRGILILP